MGLEFRESAYLINAKNQNTIQEVASTVSSLPFLTVLLLQGMARELGQRPRPPLQQRQMARGLVLRKGKERRQRQEGKRLPNQGVKKQK